jgi:hypothetical protein
MEELKRDKSLYIKINKVLHSEIKRLAAFKYITMETFFLRTLEEKLEKERKNFKDNQIP